MNNLQQGRKKTGMFTSVAGLFAGRRLLIIPFLVVMAAGIWWFSQEQQDAKQELPPVKADERVLAEGTLVKRTCLGVGMELY